MPAGKQSKPRSLKLHATSAGGAAGAASGGAGAAGAAGGGAGASGGGAGTACGNPLGFTMQHQLQTQWCWAAASVSVNLYYHPASGQTQCAVADAAMGQTTCCVDGSTPQCNQPWFLDLALQIVGNLNAVTSGKAALTTVKGQINQCRPFCLRIGWNGGGGHFVAVYGYTRRGLYIGDPWYGNSVVTYSSFPSTYQGGGVWTDNYTTKP